MKRSNKAEELAAAAATLESAPDDLGQWLRVAAALAAAGKRPDAAKAFASLGDAANSLGQVALAVACVRWLGQAKQTKVAAALIDRVATTHCRGSRLIDSNARPKPPAVSGVDSAGDVSGVKLAAAVAKATAAVAAATAAAANRAPAKHPPTALIHVLEPSDFKQLVGVMRMTRRNADHVIVDVGQPAKALYWIARGSVQVTRGEHHLGDLHSGAFFGEIALVGDMQRTAKVTCSEETWLLEIPAASVESAATKAPKLAKVLAEYARSRLLANVMRTSELFSRLDESERRTLLSRFRTQFVEAGTAIIECGAEADSLFVVVSGALEVRNDDGSPRSTLTVGDGVGESSLIARKPANADVVATEASVLLCLSRDQFDDVAVNHPSLLAEVYKLVVAREQENSDKPPADAESLIV